MNKYYYEEHEKTYLAIRDGNLEAWDQYHEPEQYNFDKFMMRPFLEEVIDLIKVNAKESEVFEYGCGTGTGACLLANKGYSVDAMDISPTAIEIAKAKALERNLKVNYTNQDILALSGMNKEYDIILDNYCLQSIVTDGDRSKLFSIVRSGLKKSGFYIIATAMYSESRVYPEDTYYCEDTGMVYERIVTPEHYTDAVMINKLWWLPHRRHLKPEELRAELTSNGFSILLQDGGNIVCTK